MCASPVPDLTAHARYGGGGVVPADLGHRAPSLYPRPRGSQGVVTPRWSVGYLACSS